MKSIISIVTALVAVAGIVFVVVAYGDKIAAWFKKMMPKCKVDVEIVPEDEVEEEAEEEILAEETPVEEVIVEEAAPVAEEQDFEA